MPWSWLDLVLAKKEETVFKVTSNHLYSVALYLWDYFLSLKNNENQIQKFKLLILITNIPWFFKQ